MPNHGIIVYEIVRKGFMINGLYTNNHVKSRYIVDNESATKVDEKAEENENKKVDDDLVGVYNCRYIETSRSSREDIVNCKLTVTRNGIVYLFTWTNDAGARIWEGIGMRAGDHHIAVSYVNPQD